MGGVDVGGGGDVAVSGNHVHASARGMSALRHGGGVTGAPPGFPTMFEYLEHSRRANGGKLSDDDRGGGGVGSGHVRALLPRTQQQREQQQLHEQQQQKQVLEHQHRQQQQQQQSLEQQQHVRSRLEPPRSLGDQSGMMFSWGSVGGGGTRFCAFACGTTPDRLLYFYLSRRWGIRLTNKLVEGRFRVVPLECSAVALACRTNLSFPRPLQLSPYANSTEALQSLTLRSRSLPSICNSTQPPRGRCVRRGSRCAVSQTFRWGRQRG